MSIFKRILQVHVNIRRYSSALYITGDKASSNFVVLMPHIDFEERLGNKAELEENIKLRGKRINLDKYKKYWEFYKDLAEKMVVLDETKREISRQVAELMKEPQTNTVEIEKLQLHAKQAKDNYKNLRDYIYPVEESAALKALSIPNILDQRTPHTESNLLYNFSEKPLEKGRYHFDIATDMKLLHYLNSTFTVLENDAALFEYAIINYIYEVMLNNDFVPTVNASFSRSIIIEGCCTDFTNPNSIFTVAEEESKFSISQLHFVGNSTLYSFMTYFTKFSIQPNYFPLKLFTTGKQYNPTKSKERSLFNLNQYSTLDTFIITQDNEQTEKMFQELINVIKEFYDSLGYHYRLVYLPAKELQDYESLRLSIQMYSSHSHNYLEVGSVSLCGDYLSKRLLVTYNDGKIRKYPHIIYGTLVNVQKILACILEYNDLFKKELLSDQLRRYIPT